MQNFKPGTDAPVTIALADEAGAILVPTALRWRVLDEADAVLLDWANLEFIPYDTSVSAIIPAAQTTIESTVTRGMRTVELEVTTETGTVFLSEVVMLQGATALLFGINTFQTYTQALLLTEDMIEEHVAGWAPASREVREKAMIESYKRIMQLPIGMHFDDQQSMLQIDTQFVQNYGPLMLRYMTPAQMSNIYKPMMKALQLAQVTEATEILNGDPVTQARKSGILSQTVGESSQFFRTAKPLELAVSPRTINILQRWVRFNMKIGRAG